jgi:hypothetical protein
MNAFFNYIRPDSLRKLEVKSYWTEFDDFIDRQSQVKDLTILERNFNQSFERLHLEYFTVIVADATAVPNDKLINLIRAHPEIKYLSTVKKIISLYDKEEFSVDCVMGVDVFNALFNDPSLKKLLITYNSQIESTNLAKCAAKEVEIKDMRHLTNVRIEDFMDMKNLEKLTIDNFTLDSESSKKFRSVRYLNLKNPSIYYNSCSFSQILSSFENLEHFECGSEIISAQFWINGAKIQYPRLKVLKLSFIEKHYKLKSFLDAFPNLETLHLRAQKYSFDLESLIKLTTMTKLKSFKTSFHLYETNMDSFPIAVSTFKKLCEKWNDFQIGFYGTVPDAIKREVSSICNVDGSCIWKN